MKLSLRDCLPIRLEGLVIRRVVSSDFDDLFEYYSDPEVARFQFWEPYDEDRVAAMIEAQTSIQLGDPGVALMLVAVSDADQRVIGDCQLTVTSPEDRQGEIGFAFNSRYTGRGLATMTVIATLGFGFDQLELHRIVACTDTRNEKSWRLMERVGMRREAHFLHDCHVKGEWVDDYVYAMLAEEWQRLRGNLTMRSDAER